MDKDAKEALIDRLSASKNFEKSYDEVNRRWFVDKVIRVFEAKQLTDDQIRENTQDVVLTSKGVVVSKRDIPLNLVLDTKRKATARDALTRRVQILYGAIAFNPTEFLDPSNSKFLDFIVRRRYRSVERMDLFVNPNTLGFFRYPDRCKADQRWRVNKDARNKTDLRWPVNTDAGLWKPGLTDSDIPILVVPDGQGKMDFVTAINQLFTYERLPCDGNLLDCQTTLCILLLDSLLEARDPAALYGELDSRSAPGVPHTYACIYLITDFTMPQPNYFFVSDSRTNGLFTTGDSEIGDVQVGDHVYIWNHPLYQIFRPKGMWRGEHSLVTDCRNRSYTSKGGLRLEGHGMVGTVNAFYSRHLKELQTLTHRAYRIGLTFLSYIRNPSTSPIAAHVTKETHSLPDSLGKIHTTDVYFFDIDFNYPDYKAVTSGQKKPTKPEHGFVILKPNDLDQFGIHHRRSIANALTDGPLTNLIPFERQPSPPDPGDDPYDPTTWTIPYQDPTTHNTIHYPLFFQNGNAIDVSQLTMNDLSSFPFFRRDATSPATFAYMTRPRVCFSAAYEGFLTSKGAI